MRPAQKAPENGGQKIPPVGRPCGFNEAGAKSAGKRRGLGEAQAGGRTASMRPAQKAPENRHPSDFKFSSPAASMRPAQKAPENFGIQRSVSMEFDKLQ